MQRGNEWVKIATAAGDLLIRWEHAAELRRRLGSGEFVDELRARGTSLPLRLSVEGKRQVVDAIDAWAGEGELDEDVVTLRDELADDLGHSAG